MAENSNVPTSESDSSLKWHHWLGLLAGGMVTGGAVGWSAYKGNVPLQLDKKTVMTLAASVAGGIGVYVTGSTIVFMSQKPSNNQTSTESASDLTSDSEITCNRLVSDLADPRFEASMCNRLVDLVQEWDGRFALEVSKVLDKKISRNINEEAARLSCKSDKTKRLEDLDQQKPRNRPQKRPIENEKETCHDASTRSKKLKFKEEIISFIDELNGYVQGAIDPLPSARNFQLFQLQSADMSHEMRRQIVMIVKEYTNSIRPKLEQVIDEFTDSVGKVEEVPDYFIEHKRKKAFENFGDREKDLSTASSKVKIKQNCNAFENATESSSPTSSLPNGQSSIAPGFNIRPMESISNPLYERRNNWTQTSEKQSLPTPLPTPTSPGIRFMAKEIEMSGHSAVQKLKSPHTSPPAKLVLNQEQMKFFNILKSELYGCSSV